MSPRLGCIVLLGLAALVMPAGAVPSTPVPPEFFGITFYSGEVPNDFVGTMGTLGKMPMTGWNYIQPASRDDFHWEGLDLELAAMKKLGLTHFIYLIGATPGWAVANHDVGKGKVSKITKKWISTLPPDDMKDFTNFIHTLLTRYPQIDLIYLACEPEGAIPVRTIMPVDRALIDYVHANFPGVKVGSPTVQPKDSGAKMLAPGYWYYDYWNQGGPKNYDVILWHGYPRLGVTKPSKNTVEVVTADRARLQALIDHFGLQALPVIDEESSWGTDTAATGNHTDTVAFVSQDLLMHWSFGDAEFVWYGGAGLAWGTLGDTTGPTLNPAGISWSQTRSWMLGSTLTAPGIVRHGVVRSGSWTRPGGYNAISAWTTDGSTADFAVPAHDPPFVQYRDTAGKVTPIKRGHVTLDGRPIWIESQPAAVEANHS